MGTFYKRIKSCIIDILKVAQIDTKRLEGRLARGRARMGRAGLLVCWRGVEPKEASLAFPSDACRSFLILIVRFD